MSNEKKMQINAKIFIFVKVHIFFQSVLPQGIFLVKPKKKQVIIGMRDSCVYIHILPFENVRDSQQHMIWCWKKNRDVLFLVEGFWQGLSNLQCSWEWINIVHTPGKIIWLNGKRIIHSKTSWNKVENVTAVICASDYGSCIHLNENLEGTALIWLLIPFRGTLFHTSLSSLIDRDVLNII